MRWPWSRCQCTELREENTRLKISVESVTHTRDFYRKELDRENTRFDNLLTSVFTAQGIPAPHPFSAPQSLDPFEEDPDDAERIRNEIKMGRWPAATTLPESVNNA